MIPDHWSLQRAVRNANVHFLQHEPLTVYNASLVYPQHNIVL